MIKIFQQGGQMNDEQKAFTAYLIKVLNPKDQRDFEDKISQLSEDDIKEFYKQFKTMENNQVSMAKLGAKLNYVQTLRGECPEGYEIEKYMAGGCVKCKKKMDDKRAVDVFKDKCGGKAKKRMSKKNMGGEVSTTWSIPKNQKGNKIDYKKLSTEDKGKADMKADSAAYAKAYPKTALAKKFNKDNQPKKRIIKKD